MLSNYLSDPSYLLQYHQYISVISKLDLTEIQQLSPQFLQHPSKPVSVKYLTISYPSLFVSHSSLSSKSPAHLPSKEEKKNFSKMDNNDDPVDSTRPSKKRNCDHFSAFANMGNDLQASLTEDSLRHLHNHYHHGNTRCRDDDDDDDDDDNDRDDDNDDDDDNLFGNDSDQQDDDDDYSMKKRRNNHDLFKSNATLYNIADYSDRPHPIPQDPALPNTFNNAPNIMLSSHIADLHARNEMTDSIIPNPTITPQHISPPNVQTHNANSSFFLQSGGIPSDGAHSGVITGFTHLMMSHGDQPPNLGPYTTQNHQTNTNVRTFNPNLADSMGYPDQTSQPYNMYIPSATNLTIPPLVSVTTMATPTQPHELDFQLEMRLQQLQSQTPQQLRRLGSYKQPIDQTPDLQTNYRKNACTQLPFSPTQPHHTAYQFDPFNSANNDLTPVPPQLQNSLQTPAPPDPLFKSTTVFQTSCPLLAASDGNTDNSNNHNNFHGTNNNNMMYESRSILPVNSNLEPGNTSRMGSGVSPGPRVITPPQRMHGLFVIDSMEPAYSGGQHSNQHLILSQNNDIITPSGDTVIINNAHYELNLPHNPNNETNTHDNLTTPTAIQQASVQSVTTTLSHTPSTAPAMSQLSQQLPTIPCPSEPTFQLPTTDILESFGTFADLSPLTLFLGCDAKQSMRLPGKQGFASITKIQHVIPADMLMKKADKLFIIHDFSVVNIDNFLNLLHIPLQILPPTVTEGLLEMCNQINPNNGIPHFQPLTLQNSVKMCIKLSNFPYYKQLFLQFLMFLEYYTEIISYYNTLHSTQNPVQFLVPFDAVTSDKKDNPQEYFKINPINNISTYLKSIGSTPSTSSITALLAFQNTLLTPTVYTTMCTFMNDVVMQYLYQQLLYVYNEQFPNKHIQKVATQRRKDREKVTKNGD